MEGAVPNAGEIEIVEDYDEETHNNWLVEHKESVRKQKQEERKQREAHLHDEDIFKKLEEREMMEELGLDPENFNEQALSDIVGTPDSKTKDCDEEALTDDQVFNLLDKLEAEEKNQADEIDPEEERNLQNTNELVQNLMKGHTDGHETKRRIARAVEPIDDSDNSDDDSDQPEEVKMIREQVLQLPEEEQEEFLIAQIQIIKAKMRKIQKEHFISDELTHLMNVAVSLEDDLQEMLFEKDEAEMIETDEAEIVETDEIESLPDAANNNKRRISFAKTDEQLLFRRNETVAEMLSKAKQQEEKLKPQQTIKREVISLDASLQQAQNKIDVKPSSPQILQKVEENLEFVKEHQSVQDFDLVNQILEASTGKIHTLQISFQHSDAVADHVDMKNDFPVNPSHFYDLYKINLAKTQSQHEFPIYVNSFEGEEELRVPILKEEAREAAYNDPRAEVSNHIITQDLKIVINLYICMCMYFQFSKISLNPKEPVTSKEIKSVLRNKSAVELETRAEDFNKDANQAPNKKSRNKKKKPRTIDDDLRDMSAYQKVMQDLVEKEPTEPEPLPKGKYIDSHTPKKRISRFKEQRSMSKT